MNVKNKPVFTFSHVGVNAENYEEAQKAANVLSMILGVDQNETNIAFFVAEKNIEVLKSAGLGKNGHIAFYTENIKAAIEYFEENGTKVKYETAKYNENNEINIIYLDMEVCGFAIHLTSKK